MHRIHIIILHCKKRRIVFFSKNKIFFLLFSFESLEENMNLCVTTQVCSFGTTAVEKVEVRISKVKD